MSKTEGSISEGQESSDNTIQVCIRVRPPEKEDVGHPTIIQVDPSATTLILESKPNPRTFSFDHVADIDATQESIFNVLGRKIIENCISGYNGTIFAYGQTGSGKTYTMLGPAEDSENLYHEQRGVIPRSFEYLYSLIKQEMDEHGDDKQFLCKCSFLEIYNEQIFDLMEPTAIPLHLRESFKTGVYVAGLSEKVVSDANEAYQALNSSMLNRRVASTSMNRESSRSHAIFTLQIESKERKGAVEHIRTSQLNLVDLAGSERQKDTNATGQRLKEAGSINKSLSNLGNVIMCLVTMSSTGKKRYIPYRDSKLTFLLRDSLGGNSKTTLIACVHPGHKCFGETLSTLQFAKRAKMIKNKAVLNEDAHGDIRTLQAEIRSLKEELRLARAGAIPREPGTGSSEPPSILKEMFLQAMELQYRASNEKMELQKDIEKLKAAYEKRGNILRSTKMVVKFRDSTIARLEGKLNETKEELIDKLEKELTSLRTQVDHQLDGYVYINENNHLKNEVNRLATANCLANIQANEKRVCMLEAKYNELKNEMDKESDEPSVTPQRCDAVSTATVEKLRSQVSSLESDNNELKKSLGDLTESSKKKEMLLTSELDSYKMKSEELEKMLKTNTTVNRIEKEKINEMHLQTVKTITTPRKERYRLRNRTVIGEALTPDLDTSIPYEVQEEASPFDSIEDTLLEDANKALLEQIKTSQDKNTELETRLSEYETDRVKQLQQQSMLESQIKQMEELLEKNKDQISTEIAKQEELSKKLQAANIDYEAAKGEISDLTIISKSFEKDLKESKLKVKRFENSVFNMESRITEFNMTIDQVTKHNDVLSEENAVLRDDLENATETARFYEAQVGEIEEKVVSKDKIIRDLEQSLQMSEVTIQDEKEKLQSLITQNMAQDNEKENVIISKMEEIKSLQGKISTLKNEHEALESTAALLRDELEARDANISSLEKKLTNADEKINVQNSQIEDLNQKYRDLEQTLESSQEQINYLQTDNNIYTKKIEEINTVLEAKQTELVHEKQKHEAAMEIMTEDYYRQVEEVSKTQEKLTKCEEQLILAEEQKNNYEQHIESLKEAVKAVNVRKSIEAIVPVQQEEITQLKTDLEEAHESKLKLYKEREDLKLDLHRQTAAKETLENECQKWQEKYHTMKRSNEKSNEEFCQVRNKLAEAQCETQEKIHHLEDRNTKLEDELWTLTNNKADLENGLIRLKAQIRIEQTGKEELRKNLADKEERLRAGDQELDKLFVLFEDSLPTEDRSLTCLSAAIQEVKAGYDDVLKTNMSLVGHHNIQQRIHRYEQVLKENEKYKIDINILKKENEKLKKLQGPRNPLQEKQIQHQ